MALTYAHWETAASGSFTVATNWSTGAVPGASTQAFLDASGSAYTVTSSANVLVDYLTVGSSATLNLTAGVFQIYSAAHTYSDGDNDGTITIGNGATLFWSRAGSSAAASSQLRNTGTVQINAGASQARLIFAAPYTRWVGGGFITMSGANAAILGGGTAALFDNRDNTISGSGRIGNSTLTLQNDKLGTINASASAALSLGTGTNTIANAGTIETTGAGGLTIASAMTNDGALIASGSGALTISNAAISGGGTIEAATGNARINLSNGSMSYGVTVSTVAGSQITSLAGTTDTLQGDVDNAGTINVQNGSTLRMSGFIDNAGSITLNGSTAKTTLKIISDGGTLLEGTGKLLLSNSANNFIVSDTTPVYFDNTSYIAGAGTIGDANLILENRVGGTINANGSVALNIVAADPSMADEDINNGLITTTGAGGMTISGALLNRGTIAAAGSGALTLKSALFNSGGGGLLQTTRAGASILLDGSSLSSGFVTVLAGTSLTAKAGTSDRIDTTLTNTGSLHVGDGATLATTDAFWTNAGLISLDGTATATTWVLGGDLGLKGHGTIELASTRCSIVSDGSAVTLKNDGNVIEGAGSIGDANMVLLNRAGSTIDATATGGLIIDTGTNTIVNAGTIRSSTASGLTIKGAMANNGLLVATTGTIDVKGAVTGGGLAEINNAAAIRFETSLDHDVVFGAGATGTLQLDKSATTPYYGDIRGFTGQDKIDLSDIAFVASGANATRIGYDGGSAAGNLTVTQGETSTKLSFLGNYAVASFTLQSDQHGGTLIA